MTPTYTEAKDQLLMALAEIPWRTRLEGAPFGSTNVLAAAAHAVLEEENHVQGQKAYDSTLLVIIEAKDKELAELKRRVGLAGPWEGKSQMTDLMPCPFCGVPPEDVETLRGVANELMDGGDQPTWSAIVLGNKLRAIIEKLESK